MIRLRLERTKRHSNRNLQPFYGQELLSKCIQCGFPAEIPNGQYQLLNGTVGYLSRVIYSCDEGYELIGRAQLTCDIDERWNGPPPRCEAIECDDPPSIPNGKFIVSNNLTVVGTTVEYSCNSRNYRLIGPNNIKCLPSGEYDDDPPECKEERQTVAAVPVPSSKPAQPQTPPGKPRDTPARPTRPSLPPARPGPQSPRQERPSNRPAASDSTPSESAHVPHIVAASHPRDNEIPDSVNVRSDLPPNVNVAHSVDEERREAGARLNLGAIIALGVFGGFVFLAAVITTIVILIQSGKKRKLPPARTMPSRWYTLLALPFPDQQVGRREFSRGAAYRNRTTAGYFSNPL